MVHFDEFLKTCSLRSNSVTRQFSFNGTKIGGKSKKNSNATFGVIFKQCDSNCSIWLFKKKCLYSIFKAHLCQINNNVTKNAKLQK